MRAQPKSLHSGDAFALLTPTKVYLWYGSSTGFNDSPAILQAVNALKVCLEHFFLFPFLLILFLNREIGIWNNWMKGRKSRRSGIFLEDGQAMSAIRNSRKNIKSSLVYIVSALAVAGKEKNCFSFFDFQKN